MCRRSGPADLRGHERDAGQHRPGLEQQLFASQFPLLSCSLSPFLLFSLSPLLPFLCACQQALEGDLPGDEPAKKALVVDVVRVPFAEAVVGPFVGGVSEVVATRIESVFVQQIEIEIGVGQERFVGVA